MKRKIFSVMVAAVLTMALSVTAFAAGSSDTSNHASGTSTSTGETVATTPQAAPAAQVATREYSAAVTPAVEAATATTPAQSVLLEQSAVPDAGAINGTAVTATAADPSMISLAKMDILLDTTVQSSLANYGIGGTNGVANIIGAASLTAGIVTSTGKQINISVPGLTSNKGIAILYYTVDPVTGRQVAHVKKPRYRRGKLVVNLPIPCTYNVVQNVSLTQ